jgi:hypothetical protein
MRKDPHKDNSSGFQNSGTKGNIKSLKRKNHIPHKEMRNGSRTNGAISSSK